jgi:hypothetical protein
MKGAFGGDLVELFGHLGQQVLGLIELAVVQSVRKLSSFSLQLGLEGSVANAISLILSDPLGGGSKIRHRNLLGKKSLALGQSV